MLGEEEKVGMEIEAESVTSVTVMVRVWVSVINPSETATTSKYILLRSESTGDSKLGADANVSAPLDVPTEKSLASVPLIEYERTEPLSTSTAEIVVTANVFSEIDNEAEIPPPFELITGASLISVNVTVIEEVDEFPAKSVALTVKR